MCLAHLGPQVKESTRAGWAWPLWKYGIAPCFRTWPIRPKSYRGILRLPGADPWRPADNVPLDYLEEPAGADLPDPLELTISGAQGSVLADRRSIRVYSTNR